MARIRQFTQFLDTQGYIKKYIIKKYFYCNKKNLCITKIKSYY